MIPFKNRFHGHSSLKYVYKKGRSVRGQSMTIKFIVNPHRNQSRLAVIVSKKTLKSAVRRNRIRRRVYEYMRLKLPNFTNIYDIAIIVTSGDLINLTHIEMSEQIEKLLKQTGMQKNL